MLASTKSETIITVCVPTNYTGILEPNPASNMAIVHTLSQVQNGLTVVQVLNTTEEDIKLHAGQQLGEFYFLSSTDTTILEGECCNVLSDPCATAPPISIDNSNLSTSQVESLKEYSDKYSDIFSKNSDDRGRTRIIKHRIRTGEAMPIKQRPYRVTPEQRQ